MLVCVVCVCVSLLRPPALGVAVLPYFYVCYFAYYFDCVQVLPVSRGRSPICFKAVIAVQKLALLQLRAATLFGPSSSFYFVFEILCSISPFCLLKPPRHEPILSVLHLLHISTAGLKLLKAFRYSSFSHATENVFLFPLP